jgi:hypothetical protein
MTTITLEGLPKISLNHFFGRSHWIKRQRIVKAYQWLLRDYEKINYKCSVEYHFEFKSNPLDCSNCAGMVKLIEDCLFADDSYKSVKSLFITSSKSKKDIVKIIIKN